MRDHCFQQAYLEQSSGRDNAAGGAERTGEPRDWTEKSMRVLTRSVVFTDLGEVVDLEGGCVMALLADEFLELDAAEGSMRGLVVPAMAARLTLEGRERPHVAAALRADLEPLQRFVGFVVAHPVTRLRAEGKDSAPATGSPNRS